MPSSKKQPTPDKTPRNHLPSHIIAIGASAGGLEALGEFFRHMKQDTESSFVIIQHLDPTHESLLSDILSKITSMPVLEAKQGALVEARHVYVIPPNVDMTISSWMLNLAPRTKKAGQSMPIDIFFRSLASEQKEKAVGVVLSGTGTDG